MHEERIIRILKESRIDLISSLPCDKAKELFFLLPHRFRHVGLTREEDGVGVSAGAYLAGGRPAMVIQSSGLGNMLNALMSLSVTYQFPLPVIASWRGVYHETIPAQIPFNRVLPAILDGARIPYTIINESEELEQIGTVIDVAFEEETPHVALLSPRCFEEEGVSDRASCGPLPYRARTADLTYIRNVREPQMTRSEAIRSVVPLLEDEAVVGNIGVPGKELFAARDRALNFYMLGSYTQASPIGLGLALQGRRDVVVVDGDGSLLGTGILSCIAASHPENLTILCLDNGTFGSTGDQPTPAYHHVDLELIAIAHGIKNTCKVQDAEELREAFGERGRGPNFIHTIIRPGNEQVGNIPLTPKEIRDRFMRAW